MTEGANIDEQFEHGIDLFNRREFYDCHEVLEDVWNLQSDPEKQLTQGIIQIAVGYYHALRGNVPGAVKLFHRGIARVKPFCPSSRNLQLAEFLSTVEHDLATLTSGQSPPTLTAPDMLANGQATATPTAPEMLANGQATATPTAPEMLANGQATATPTTSDTLASGQVPDLKIALLVRYHHPEG